MRTTCDAHLILVDLITLIIFGKAYFLSPRHGAFRVRMEDMTSWYGGELRKQSPTADKGWSSSFGLGEGL